MPRFLRHAGVKNDLKQQVAKFITQCRQIFPLDRIRDFVGFLDRVRRDRREGLLLIPWTSVLRVPELSYNLK